MNVEGMSLIPHDDTTPTGEPSPVSPLPFVAGLIAAPILVALPFLGMLWLASFAEFRSGGLALIAIFPVAAPIFGAPTYLLFGGPAMWRALRRGGSVSGAAMLANLLSLPFVFLFFLVVGEPDNAWGMIGIYAVLGTLFALIWSLVFLWLYRLFGGEVSDAQAD